jgi:hypothetical protein
MESKNKKKTLTEIRVFRFNSTRKKLSNQMYDRL